MSHITLLFQLLPRLYRPPVCLKKPTASRYYRPKAVSSYTRAGGLFVSGTEPWEPQATRATRSPDLDGSVAACAPTHPSHLASNSLLSSGYGLRPKAGEYDDDHDDH